MFREQGLAEKEDGWYLVPGKVDRINYVLLAFFVFTLCFLLAFDAMIG